MKENILIRYGTGNEGTPGIFAVEGFWCYSLELPWRNNEPFFSCIPVGEYIVVPYSSNKYKNVYHIMNVPDRWRVLIHWGNFAGDVKKGFKTHVEGCQIVGSKIGSMDGQLAVLNSRVTFSKLRRILGEEPFKLRIIEKFSFES